MGKFYETNPSEALKNGYTKAHYEEYLASKGKASPTTTEGSTDSAQSRSADQQEQQKSEQDNGESSTLTANDEEWARYYEKDPEGAKKAGYSEAHYEDYKRKKALQ